ncbi:helix-hairpin-helix domain-containing protein [Porphyromonas sp. oral taxon 275]|uniref:ComEA family DNA-binding protein n=1 Tax=Porphyromonas sp. oral taxon 275 TaxID=712435 RepID=UPI001BA89A6F|nr:helix-hairpin-helix domain-containing protein [Porphyromonas sp. oral taxon 275]QUB42790.1 helix-hairpin-helix domain-containing protein [Porphyromonas sp. oral taxon 275]
MRQGDHPIGKAERIVLMLLVIVLSSALALYAWTQYRSPSPGAVAALAPSPSSDSTTASAPTPELRKGVYSAPERRDSAQRLVTSPDYVGPPSGTERTVAKYQHYVSLDLNAVDSLTLLRVPGIGPAFAHRILSLRSRLGGYYTVLQLQEVYGMDADRFVQLRPWFAVRTPPRQHPLSALRADSLPWHPYLNRAQLQGLRLGVLREGRRLSWRHLRQSPAFSREDSIRLAPYFPDSLHSAH